MDTIDWLHAAERIRSQWGYTMRWKLRWREMSTRVLTFDFRGFTQ